MSKVYLLCEDNIGKGVNHAGAIAKNDIAAVLKKENVEYFYLVRRQIKSKQLNKLYSHVVYPLKMFCKLQLIKKTDRLIIQHPMMGSMKLNDMILGIVQKIKKFPITFIIHDLDHLRYYKDRKELELKLLNKADSIVCHNAKMKAYLESVGFGNKKIVELGLFDYLIGPEKKLQGGQKNGKVIVAGGLSRQKAGYMYASSDMENPIHYNLYGRWFDKTFQDSRVSYYGAFDSSDLPEQLSGEYGLVWDGPITTTCKGETGEYLKYNNPHKVSLYLACGIPVAIWKEAALAPFIEKNNLGITIESLDELDSKMKAVTDVQYKNMLNNVKKLSTKVRSGYFISHAIRKVLE